MHPLNEALAAMEARCRLADAAGGPVTWSEFADILREARREMERQDARTCEVPPTCTAVSKQSPKSGSMCQQCSGRGSIFVIGKHGYGYRPQNCSACEGSGVTP